MIIFICQGDWILCTLTHSWQVISQVSNWDCLISALPWTSHWWACSVLTFLSFKMHWTVDRALIWRRLLPHLKISICTGGSHQPPKEGCILAVTMKKGRLLVVTSLAYKSHLKERHALLAITWKHKFKCSGSLSISCTASCNFSAQISLDIWRVSSQIFPKQHATNMKFLWNLMFDVKNFPKFHWKI